MKFELRPWLIGDAPLAAELATPNVSRYMSDAFPGNSVEKWEKFIRFANENPSAFYRVIEVDGKFAGNIGVLIQEDIMKRNAELGYWIGDVYRGQGITTRAIIEMVKITFDNYEVSRIYATPFGNNFASQRVLEKAGFVLEAMFEKIYLKNGQMYDELVYAKRKI